VEWEGEVGVGVGDAEGEVGVGVANPMCLLRRAGSAAREGLGLSGVGANKQSGRTFFSHQRGYLTYLICCSLTGIPSIITRCPHYLRESVLSSTILGKDRLTTP
jgi:hypothetical protein